MRLRRQWLFRALVAVTLNGREDHLPAVGIVVVYTYFDRVLGGATLDNVAHESRTKLSR